MFLILIVVLVNFYKSKNKTNLKRNLRKSLLWVQIFYKIKNKAAKKKIRRFQIIYKETVKHVENNQLNV